MGPIGNATGRAGGWETGHGPKDGKQKRAAAGAGYARPGPGPDRQPHKSGIALPADLGRSLRLLDDAQLDRLTKAVTDEIRRRGRNPPASSSVAVRSAKRAPAGAARENPEEPVRAATVTPGQERLILPAFEPGLRPGAIAKELRVSRSKVRHDIIAPQHDRRKTER